MKKYFSKFIAALIILSMIFPLLPAQFVLAARDVSEFTTYGEDINSLKSSDYAGHVYELTEVTGDETHNLELSAGVYNMDLVSFYETGFWYDTNVVDLQFPNYNYPFAIGEDASSFYTLGTVTESMVNSTNPVAKSYAGKSLSDKLFTTVIDIAEVEGSSYMQVHTSYILNMTGMTTSYWTNSSTGAKMEAIEGALEGCLGYKFPTDEICNIFTMHFKVKEGQTVTADTFKIYDDEFNGFCGGRGVTELVNTDTSTSANKPVIQYSHNEGIYLIGFEEPATPPVEVTFSVVDSSNTSTAISGATVALYTDQNCTTPATASDGTALTGQTDGTGSVTIQNVPANKKYYYKVTASNYDEATGGPVSVGSSNMTVSDAIQITKETEKTYDLNVTVKNADDGSILPGATVLIENASAGTTDTNGQLTAKRTVGSYKVKASMDGYQTSAENDVSVTTSGGSTEIKLVPNRIKLTLPEIHDANGKIDGAQFTIVKTSTNQTDAWVASGTYNAGTEIEIPANSTFMLTTSTTGYSSQTLYVETDATSAKIYTDSNKTPFTDANVTVNQLGDPYYRVEFTNDGAGTYTATVYLKNIEAVNGTFGMRYDKDVFTFQNCELNDALDFPKDSTNANPFPAVTQNDTSDQIGYHVFSWIVKNTTTTFDTRSAELPVAMYTFALNSGKTEKDIDANAFTVMPYDRTAAASSYITQNGRDDTTNEYLDMLWRYTDAENDPNNLGEARLAEEFATDRGFYQVFSYDHAMMADVMTMFEGIDGESAALVFEAEDDNGSAVKDVEIILYDSTGKELKTLKTDSTGIAKTSIDTSNGSVTYKYKASCLGYWDIELTSVTVPQNTPPATKYEYLLMKEKIYHNVKLEDGSGNAITDAKLTGDDYAYNTKDYHFNIIANTGKAFDMTKANVVAEIEGVDYPVTFSIKDNMFVIPGAQITGAKTGSADIHGFPSKDIIIKINPSSISDSNDKYTVTALAGTGGTVAYANPSDPDAAIDPNGKEVVVSNISPGGSTQDFTFTADTASGQLIEKVVINGVEYDLFDDSQSFSYSFTDITEDCSIAVTFYNGKDPSDDSIVTLVVGEHGSVDVTAPAAEAETGITKERRAYIFTSAGDLTFNETPEAGYELNPVEQEVNGGAKQPLSPTSGTTYSAHVGTSENVVIYVTFRAPGETDTFNVFVKSYVAKGKGTITPMGIMIHTKRERPLFYMATINNDPDWQLTSVLIDGIKQRYIEQSKDDEQHDSGTYQFAPLTEDTSIGAVFTETAYVVHGIVDLSNGFTPLVTTNNAVTGATLKFTRDDGIEVIAYSGNERTGATFDANLAKGKWTVEITKKGYLKYIITDFEVQKADITFGAAAGSNDPRPIVLTIGDTSGKGNVVSFEDAGVVAGSMRIGASQKLTDKGNIDDSDDNKILVNTDMVYVMTNYGKRYTQKTYTDFVAGK